MKEQEREEFIPNIQEYSICLFCGQRTKLLTHIEQCPGILPESLHNNPTHYRVADKDYYVCKFCSSSFKQKQWQQHRKTSACRNVKNKKNKYPKDGLSVEYIKSLPQIERKHSIHENQVKFFSEGHKTQLREDKFIGKKYDQVIQENKIGEMVGIAKSILSPLLRQWLNRNSNIDINVLVVYLTSAIMDFGTCFLGKPIIVPTWVTLRQISNSFDWEKFFDNRPQNIFNERYIDNKLQNMDIKKKERSIRVLNKLSGVFKGLIKRRQVPKIQRKQKQRGFVSMKDVILLIKELFDCGKRQTTHLAIDLYIILLSGQRFGADIKQIQKGVSAMVRQNVETENVGISYYMIIGKNKRPQQVVLNRQLVLILKEFNWCQFHKNTYRIVGRMRQWCGITGYSFKDTMLTTVTAVASDLQLAQSVAGHKAGKSINAYTKLTYIGDTQKVTQRLVIPGLHSRFGSYDDQKIISYLQSLKVPNVHYKSFSNNRINLAIQRLYQKGYEKLFKNDYYLNFAYQDRPLFNIEKQLDNQDEKQEEIKIEKRDQNNMIIDEELKDDLQKETIISYGKEYELNGNKFVQQHFFLKIDGQKVMANCENCSLKIKPGKTIMRCVICSGDHHQSCINIICSCSITLSHADSPSIPLINRQIQLKPSKVKILLPTIYMRERTLEQQQIRILLATRHFRYTRVPVFSPGYSVIFPEKYWEDVKQWINLPVYKQYITGKYMPPIQARPIKSYQDHPVYGRQWGIFSTDAIADGVFIGEYACDILSGKDLYVCKKLDSAMRYSGGGTPLDVFLAPKDYCGFVPLVNSGKKQQCNCNILRVVINGSLRIILLTKRRIRKGQQLKYYYGDYYYDKDVSQ